MDSFLCSETEAVELPEPDSRSVGKKGKEYDGVEGALIPALLPHPIPTRIDRYRGASPTIRLHTKLKR